MKKYIIFLLTIIATTINLRAQYVIVRNQMVLPELISDNDSFSKQLDSILFIKKPVFSPSDDRVKRGFVFFANIKEPKSRNYLISITYGIPTLIEKYLNTGIYTMKGYYFIIREDSNQTPLFKTTGGEVAFKYEKELIKRDDDSPYCSEINYPERVRSWFLSFSNNQLKEISRDEYIAITSPPE